MKKIMIFYGSYGGGHLSAARSIKDYIDANYQDVETCLVDCIEYINKYPRASRVYGLQCGRRYVPIR